jgi:hypothetical protein
MRGQNRLEQEPRRHKSFQSILMLVGKAESRNSNKREPEGCLGRVFKSKLDSFPSLRSIGMTLIQQFLELKTRPRLSLAY